MGLGPGTVGFNRDPGAGSTDANILIMQARGRIMSATVDREPNDEVLLVLGSTNAGITALAASVSELAKGVEDVATAVEEIARNLPSNGGNGRVAKAKALAIPAGAGIGFTGVAVYIIDLLKSAG